MNHQALIITPNRAIKLTKTLTIHAGPGEILVSPLFIGVCGTDLQILNGMRPDRAAILGHEGVAEIIAVGNGVSNWAVGEKVVFNPVNINNQEEILGHSINGLFQQRLLISNPSLQSGLVTPFEPGVPLICGPLVEPLGTVVYGQSLVSRACTPHNIAIIGAGSIGLLHAIYARQIQDVETIFLISSKKERLEWAVQSGIVHHEEALLEEYDIEYTLMKRTQGQGVDAVYLCTSRASALKALEKALNIVKHNGCIDLVCGFSNSDRIAGHESLDINQIRKKNFCGIPGKGYFKRLTITTHKEVILTGHRGTSTKHLQKAMKVLGEKSRQFNIVITHIVSLEEAPTIIEHLAYKKSREVNGKECVKVVIDLSN